MEGQQLINYCSLIAN